MHPVIDNAATGKRLRLLMRIKGISTRQLQQYLGLSCVQSIYHWLDGICMPSIDNLYTLSDLFQIPLDDLICGSKEKQKESFDREFAFRVSHYYFLLQQITKSQSTKRLCIDSATSGCHKHQKRTSRVV